MIHLRFKFNRSIAPLNTRSCRRAISNISSNQGAVTRLLHHEWIIDGKIIPRSASAHVGQDDRRTVIFLHGLLGSGKNLRNPAKRLTQQFPNLKALLLDLRGHGQSSNGSMSNKHMPGDHEQHTIFNCAQDIVETTKKLNLTGQNHSPIGIIGHSFGGRCALQYVHTLKNNSYSEDNNNNSISPPRCTWLLDTVPGKAHASVSNVIQALTNIEISKIKSKQELVKVLTFEQNIDKNIANWMTTNVQKLEDGRFEFMFDLETAKGVLEDFPKQDFMKMIDYCTSIESRSIHNHDEKVYLVMAGKNNAWTDDIVTDLESLAQKQNLELVTLPKAGHWVHVDDLDGLMNAMGKCFIKMK